MREPVPGLLLSGFKYSTQYFTGEINPVYHAQPSSEA